MYCEKIVLRNLDEFAAREGWMPVYHSLEQVEEFKRYIDSLVKIESNSRSSYVTLQRPITQKRQKEIWRWIENEQALCGLDSGYFESRYAYVCDEKGQIFKFQNRLSQKIFDGVIAGFDEKQVSIELMILKARQVGVTTKTALKFLHRLLFVPHTQAVMASVQSDKSELIGRILDTAYNRCPWWLVPRRLPKGAYDNGSVLSIQSGMQATGIAQGWTPTCLVPGTPVRVANGGVKAIEDLVSGDRVLTHDGRLAAVKCSFETSRHGEPTRILKLWGCYLPLETTLDHCVWTPDGWCEAEDLGVGDFVRYPVREIRAENDGEPLQKMLRGKIDAAHAIEFELTYSPAVAYLAGLYLAEGSCHESGIGKFNKNPYLSEVIFSVHRREAVRTETAIRAVLGEDQHIHTKNHGENGSQVCVSCAWLARWLAENFGRKYDKHVPDWIWTVGRDFCLYFLKGYLDGDGHCEKNSNHVIAPCICEAITLQMRDLVASLGFGWASIYHQAAMQSPWGGKKRETWKLVMVGMCGYRYRMAFNLEHIPSNEKARHWHYSEDGSAIDVKIEKVDEGFSESFYDVEVNDAAHSFTTLQCSVHNCIHVSELADIPKPEKVIEEGLLRATHSSRNLFMVFEGTGGGNTGWLANTWRSAKADWPKGQSRLCPVFIPWAMVPDLYPEPDWVRKFPVPAEFMRKRQEVTRKHVQRCELYIRNTAYLANVVGADWRMPIEQQWFWEFNYLQACKNHTQKIWLAQMAADDFEALTGVHDSVFDLETIQEIENHVYEVESDNKERKKPVQAYAITGDSIDDGFEPDDSIIDYDKDRIRILWNSDRGQQYKWVLIPLLPVNEEIETETFDKFLVYEEPKAGYSYSCGIDTADGLGKEDEDRTCVSMTRNRFGDEFDYQVAELTSNRINSAQIVGFAACMAAWYGERTQDSRGVKFCVEQIGRPGDTCQHQLKLMGFHWHHVPRRYDSKKIKDDSGKKQGWYSNVWSVPILMTRFTEAVNGGWYRPASKWLIEELKTLERHAAAGRISKMEHRSGQHDDRVRAAAQSFFTAHDFDILADRAQKRYALPQEKNPPLCRAVCSMNMAGVGSWE
jgi:hypothetical protein